MDFQAIVRLLIESGEYIIMPALQQLDNVYTKADGSVVTEVDVRCQAFIRERLLEQDSDIGFLAEEMTADEQQACLENGGTYWCLDPLDGTTNFTNSFPLFAISLAMIENGRPIMGCVHDPLRCETFVAKSGQGAWLNGKPIKSSTLTSIKESVGMIDFKRLSPRLAAHLASKSFYRSQRNIGSCVLEWAWLAAGRAQFILHGGEKLWDYAAGLIIAEEAGCIVSDFSGRHPFDKHQLSSPIAAACNKTVHSQIVKQLDLD